ncbi:hypothetical protein RIF29_18877 [Crotalaria pallida]|uniref:Uncharacterized protein n=1 Tax=Crotalaria pallida TaxID=3830 RepID=A0AAN9F2Y1_CROPI
MCIDIHVSNVYNYGIYLLQKKFKTRVSLSITSKPLARLLSKLSTPVFAPSPKDNNDTNLAKGDSIPMNFSLLDDMNIDDLSPKKQEELLSLLDETRNRIKGKEEVSTDVS